MTTLTFQATTLSVINQQNKIWFSISDVANALGYKETNGGIQKVRIFSLRGCHLIGMLSHTKVAKDFRKWVLDILDKAEILQNSQPNLPLVEEKS